MLGRLARLAVGALALACIVNAPLRAQPPQQQTEPRIAFVVGNAGYAPGALPTALNDAGLVAEALRSIGFEIVEGADLPQADLIRRYREFLEKVAAAGPDALAFVYFSGHALSYDGENFLIGVDARLARDSDIPIESVRLSDLLGPLGDSPARAKVMMIDAARPLPFRPQGRPLARGLEAVDAPKGVLIAYSSGPGTVVPDRPGAYGAYATAIAEMLRAPGTDLETAFTHIRSRTHQTSEGQQTPWHVSALGEPIELVPPQAATAATPPPPPIRQARPMREIGPDEAYALAIEMDTLEGYSAFVEAYPRHAYSARVWAMIRARREALAWMRALEINTPQSYWTYLRRYPNGMYAVSAERRLRRLGQQFAPPPDFAMVEFDDVPMALAGEPVEYEEVYRVGPPPPRGIYLAPRPAYLVNLPPPQRRGGGNAAARILPALAVAAIPAIAALAPAPRRAFSPDSPGANRQGGGGGSGRGNRGNAGRTPPTQTSVAPNPAIAPSAVAPSTAAPSPAAQPPGAAPGQRRDRPPGWGPSAGRPPAAAPGVAPPPAGATAPTAAPSAAPSTAQPPAAGQPQRRQPGAPPPNFARRPPPGGPAAAPPVAPPPGAAPAAPPTQPPPAARRPPPGAPPPPALANRPPPQAAPPPARPPGPPPQVNRPPPPPPAAIARPAPPAAPMAAPPPRPAPPPAAAAARPPAPPPPRPAAAPPARPACPPGKTLKPGPGGQMTCA